MNTDPHPKSIIPSQEPEPLSEHEFEAHSDYRTVEHPGEHTAPTTPEHPIDKPQPPMPTSPNPEGEKLPIPRDTD